MPFAKIKKHITKKIDARKVNNAQKAVRLAAKNKQEAERLAAENKQKAERLKAENKQKAGNLYPEFKLNILSALDLLDHDPSVSLKLINTILTALTSSKKTNIGVALHVVRQGNIFSSYKALNGKMGVAKWFVRNLSVWENPEILKKIVQDPEILEKILNKNTEIKALFREMQVPGALCVETLHKLPKVIIKKMASSIALPLSPEQEKEGSDALKALFDAFTSDPHAEKGALKKRRIEIALKESGLFNVRALQKSIREGWLIKDHLDLPTINTLLSYLLINIIKNSENKLIRSQCDTLDKYIKKKHWKKLVKESVLKINGCIDEVDDVINLEILQDVEQVLDNPTSRGFKKIVQSIIKSTNAIEVLPKVIKGTIQEISDSVFAKLLKDVNPRFYSDLLTMGSESINKDLADALNAEPLLDSTQPTHAGVTILEFIKHSASRTPDPFATLVNSPDTSHTLQKICHNILDNPSDPVLQEYVGRVKQAINITDDSLRALVPKAIPLLLKAASVMGSNSDLIEKSCAYLHAAKADEVAQAAAKARTDKINKMHALIQAVAIALNEKSAISEWIKTDLPAFFVANKKHLLANSAKLKLLKNVKPAFYTDLITLGSQSMVLDPAACQSLFQILQKESLTPTEQTQVSRPLLAFVGQCAKQTVNPLAQFLQSEHTAPALIQLCENMLKNASDPSVKPLVDSIKQKMNITDDKLRAFIPKVVPVMKSAALAGMNSDLIEKVQTLLDAKPEDQANQTKALINAFTTELSKKSAISQFVKKDFPTFFMQNKQQLMPLVHNFLSDMMSPANTPEGLQRKQMIQSCLKGSKLKIAWILFKLLFTNFTLFKMGMTLIMAAIRAYFWPSKKPVPTPAPAPSSVLTVVSLENSGPSLTPAYTEQNKRGVGIVKSRVEEKPTQRIVLGS